MSNFLVSLHVTKGDLFYKNKVDWNWCARFLRASLYRGNPADVKELWAEGRPQKASAWRVNHTFKLYSLEPLIKETGSYGSLMGVYN